MSRVYSAKLEETLTPATPASPASPATPAKSAESPQAPVDPPSESLHDDDLDICSLLDREASLSWVEYDRRLS